MSPLCPMPEVDAEPRTWPGLTLLAATVLLEAEGESDVGKLAVAWVIRNRMDQKRLGVHAIVLAPWQFSAFNGDYAHIRRSRLRDAKEQMWEACWRAGCAAYWRLIPDPSQGASNYLNVPLTRTLRGGDLPDWFDDSKVVAEIGQHTFLRLVG